MSISGLYFLHWCSPNQSPEAVVCQRVSFYLSFAYHSLSLTFICFVSYSLSHYLALSLFLSYSSALSLSVFVLLFPSPTPSLHHFPTFFLSAFLRNFILCKEGWHGNVPSHLVQPCCVALGRALDLGLISRLV